MVVRVHGDLGTAVCIQCKKTHDISYFNQSFQENKKCACQDLKCKGSVKPNLMFYGETVTPLFYETEPIVRHADLAMIVGYDLSTQPLSGVLRYLHAAVPMVIVNETRLVQPKINPQLHIFNKTVDESVRQILEDLLRK